MKNNLEVDSVVKYFDNKLILSDVYLKCETGNIIGLLGRNGSGKSTLLKIIFGFEAAENKFIRINNHVKLKTSQLLADISYLSQENFIPNSISVKKAIDLSIDKSSRKTFYDNELLSKLLKNKISTLSSGELRYLEIMLVLNNSSKFVLLDEPYNGLSPNMVTKINQLILENSATKGIIITDHNYRNVIEISTQLILIKEAKTHHLKSKEELITKGYLNEGML
jgi:ABC-type multidrug transport system ATPase subunit